MGRPPCCDRVGIKKGPWTPEEDIILVSYIREHGPGNWRSVPTNTGLMRCGKSCRLRWTNYLRPGIKRGNFTPHEEGMIIHLQALLGNKWAAIASYLPRRTDNDIKNYWNTHLKKKLKKFEATLDPRLLGSSHHSSTTSHFLSNCFNDRRSSNLDISTSLFGLNQSHQSSSTYASSTANISKLLEGWMRSSPKPETSVNLNSNHGSELQINSGNFENRTELVKSESAPAFVGSCCEETKDEQEVGDMVSHEEFDSILSFENMNNAACWDKSTCDSIHEKLSYEADEKDDVVVMAERSCKQRSDHENSNHLPLSFLEKWLLDENVGQVEETIHLSPMF